MLALVGFGLKAGIMPLHVWLPAAHANAPSHVSAVMSGVMIKMGIYGLVRVTGLLPRRRGVVGLALLLAVGAASGVLGVALRARPARPQAAAGLPQHREHRHHRDGAGAGADGPAARASRTGWRWGSAGALLHVWNHGLFKSLLFLGAGAVIHAAGTREIDRMGGLAQAMPATACAVRGRRGGDLRPAAAERLRERVG